MLMPSGLKPQPYDVKKEAGLVLLIKLSCSDTVIQFELRTCRRRLLYKNPPSTRKIFVSRIKQFKIDWESNLHIQYNRCFSESWQNWSNWIIGLYQELLIRNLHLHCELECKRKSIFIFFGFSSKYLIKTIRPVRHYILDYPESSYVRYGGWWYAGNYQSVVSILGSD